MRFKLEGVIPALLTVFTDKGDTVDIDATCALATRLADAGVHGIFPCGTTGEGMLMSLDERKAVIEALVKAVGKRLRVIAHTGCLDTRSTIELTAHAAACGAAGAGVVAPAYHGYDDKALAAHYKAVAKAVPRFPVLLYNIPGCAKNELSPGLILKLANEVDNIVGLKDSSGKMDALNMVLGNAPKGFHVISGVDQYFYQALLGGAKGCVASHANVVPQIFLEIYDSVRKGQLKKAWKAQVRLCRVCAIFQYGAMPAYNKEGLRLLGFEAGPVRPPHRELTGGERKKLAQMLKAEGLR